MSNLASGLRIRPVGAADLDAIAVLQERSIMAFGAPVYGEAKAKAWARLGFEFRRDLLGPGGFWVAERGDRIVGVGGWSPDSLEPDVAWLRYLFVHPQAAGRGIGRRLVEEAERSAGAARPPAAARLVQPERGRLLPDGRLSRAPPRPLADPGAASSSTTC